MQNAAIIETVWAPSEFRAALESAFTVAFAREREAARRTLRRTQRMAARLKAPSDAGIDAHRLEATPTIEVEDWFADAPFATGESNVPTLRVPDTEYVGKLPHEEYNFAASARYDVDSEPYTMETRQVLDDVATVRWLNRDEAPYRLRWSEQDERQVILGRLRWAVDEAARKHRTTRREALRRFPAARAAMQQALALKARWNFQHEVYRAGATPTPDVTRWCKTAFGRTYETALQEIRSARVASQRQPFAAVRAGLI